MPHDNTGQELHVGDIVLVPARIKAIHQTEHYCNVTLVTREVMPPTTEPTELTLNSHQVYRDPFNGGPPRASRDAGQTDTQRLDKLFRLLPFRERHRFGGDLQEFREGIDAAPDSEKAP